MSLVTPSTSAATSSPNSLAHLVERGARVLDRVVQQRGAQRLGVEPHAGADLGHADRVDDEVLAATAALVGVALAGEHERVARRGRGRPARRPRRRAPRRSRTGRRAARARPRQVGRDRRSASAPDGWSATVDRDGGAATATGLVDRRARRRRIGGRAASSSSAGVRPLAAVGVAGQVSESVLEPSMVGPEGRRVLERGARRATRRASGPAPRDRGRRDRAPRGPARGGPRARPTSAADPRPGARPRASPRTSPARAARGRGRSAGRAGRSPTGVFVGQSVAQRHPTPDGLSRLAGRTLEQRASAGVERRVDGDDVRERRRPARGRPPARPTSRPRSRRCGPCSVLRAVRRVRHHREHGLAAGDEVGEQPGDPGPARVARSRSPRRRGRRRAAGRGRAPSSADHAGGEGRARRPPRSGPRRRGSRRARARAAARPTPFQRLTSSRTAASTGSSGLGGQPACRRRTARSASGRRRRASVKATWRPSAIARGSVERARPARAAHGAGLPWPNGASRSSSSASAERERVAGHDRVDPQLRARGQRA